MNKLFFVFIFIFINNSFSAKIYPSAGTTSATFLKIPVGSRASSMAGAFTSINNDIYSSFYNPSGLSNLENKTLSFMHNDYFSNFSQVYSVYSFKGENIKFLNKFPHFSKGNWAISLNYFFTQKDLENRSGLYENDPLYPISPVEGTFRASDLALAIHYGFDYNSYTSLGYSLKFINQKIDSYSGSSFALDLGIMKKFEIYNKVFDFGFSVQNIGPGIKLNYTRYDLPLTFRMGMSNRILEKNLLLSFDILKYIDNYPYLILGFENSLTENLFLRLGYKYRINGNELGAWSGFATGLGINIKRFSFDYSFNPYGDLGISHKITITFKFKEKEKEKISTIREIIPEEEKIKEIKQYIYNLNIQVSKISPYYTEYKVNGENNDSFINKLSFKTRNKGEINKDFFLLYGNLEKEIKDLNKINKVFSFSYNNFIVSDIDIELKIEKKWLEEEKIKKEDLSIFYYKDDKLKEIKNKIKNEDEKFVYYNFTLLQSPQYIIGSK